MRLVPVVAVMCLWLPLALAQPSPPVAASISIDQHEAMHVGARATLTVQLTLPADTGEPVLLTTSSEGSALDVVRGRLLRLDAEDPKAQTLRFAVPIVARAAGTAIFRVHALYYRCQASCVAVEEDAESLIEIAPAP